jgi:hydrogenase maturation protease
MAGILVLGIGNILLKDEGVGVHVVQTMADQVTKGMLRLPEEVELVDGGTFGIDLLDTIAGRRKVIVVDAVQVTAAETAEPSKTLAGAILRFTAADLQQRQAADLSLHQIGLFETLTMAQQLGCAVGEVVILGIVPKTLESGLELSPEVVAAVPKVIELVLKEIRDAGFEPRP